MKRVRKVFLWFIIIFIILSSISIIFLFSKKDTIISFLDQYLNKHLQTQIIVSEINFSVFKNFPNATVELSEVVIKSPSTFPKAAFKAISTDTLMRVQTVFCQFNLMSILKKQYNIKTLKIQNGELNIYVDESKQHNLNIWKSKISPDTMKSYFNLENIILSNINIHHNNKATNLIADITTERLVLKGTFLSSKQDIRCKGKYTVNVLSIKNKKILTRTNAISDIHCAIKNRIWTFHKSKISLNKVLVDFLGKFNNNNKLILNFSCSRTNFNALNELFTEKLIDIKNIDFNGRCNLKGEVSSALNKSVLNIEFNIPKGYAILKNQNEKFNFYQLQGEYFKKFQPNNTDKLKISCQKIIHRNSIYKGTMSITNLLCPHINLDIHGDIHPQDFNYLIDKKSIEFHDGKLSVDWECAKKLKSFSNLTIQNIIASIKTANIHTENVSLNIYPNTKIYKINGHIIIGENISFENCSFFYNESNFIYDGEIHNLFNHIFKKQLLYISGNIFSKNLYLTSFIHEKRDSSSVSLMKLPYRINTSVRVNQFSYKEFSAKNITGIILYNTDKLTFNNMHLETDEGVIEGDLLFRQDNKKNIHFQSISSLSRMNIQKLFNSFNNFGQSTILADNLKGKVNGKIYCLGKWNENLNLYPESLNVLADIRIEEGELIHYKPMLELSKFIDVKELEHIKFNTLENTIQIKDRKIIIPEMEIQSSAFSLQGSGFHYFNNSYEYKLLVELKELLAKKAKTKLSNQTEFGEIEEEEVGKIKIPVKITGEDNNYKVEFDKRKALNNLKKNIQNQKKELQNLFHKNKTEENEPFEMHYINDSISSLDKNKPKLKPKKPEDKKTEPSFEWNDD